MSVWTSFVHTGIHDIDNEFGCIFVEANELCAKMFLDNIYPYWWNSYKPYYKANKPAIENVTEYTTENNRRVRVICLDELKELGLVSKCEHEVNLLFYPEHKNTCTNHPF